MNSYVSTLLTVRWERGHWEAGRVYKWWTPELHHLELQSDAPKLLSANKLTINYFQRGMQHSCEGFRVLKRSSHSTISYEPKRCTKRERETHVASTRGWWVMQCDAWPACRNVNISANKHTHIEEVLQPAVILAACNSVQKLCSEEAALHNSEIWGV